jgi:hypothetical protein
LSHKKASVILFRAGNPLKKSDRRRTIATAVDMIDNASTLNTSLRWPSQQACLMEPLIGSAHAIAADGALRGMIERRDRKGSEAGWDSNQETGSSGPAARVQFKPARRHAGANPVLSLMKAELPRAANWPIMWKILVVCGLCFPASPLRSASGPKARDGSNAVF